MKQALVVIDLQDAIIRVSSLLRVNLDEILHNNKQLVEAAIAHEIPVFLITVKSPLFTDKMASVSPELAEYQKNEHVFHFIKHAPSAFTIDKFLPKLKKLGVEELIMTGVSTSNGVLKTARDGANNAFSIVVARDAAAARKASTHDDALIEMAEFGTISTTAEIIEKM